MAVNRFWGQTQNAQFDPLSMQELAFAPQQMYQREQESLAKMEALNESKNTLNAVLGDKAVVPEKFNAEYQQVLDDIQRNGANSRNVDRANKLKSLYATEVKPIEKFAADRMKWDEMYMKEAMDKNNIVLGDRPTTKTYEEYRKNPDALQFSVVGRDKLMSQGLINGKEIAKSLTKEWNTGDGFHHIQEGFSTADEAMDAYKNNKGGFRDQVESRVTDLAAANGGVNHPEVEASIRKGILSSVVGEQKIVGIPGWGTGMRGGNNMRDTTSLIHETDMQSPADKPFETIRKMSHVKDAINNYISSNTELVNKGIKSSDQLDAIIDELDNEGKITEPLKNASGIMGMVDAAIETGTRAADKGLSFASGEYKEPNYNGIPLSDLKMMRGAIDKAVQGNIGYSKDVMIRPNMQMASWNPELYNGIERSLQSTGDDINSTIGSYATDDRGIYGATTSEGQKALKEFADLPLSKRSISVKGVRINASPDEKSGQMIGTGYTTVVVDLVNKDAKKGEKGSQEVILHLPPQETQRAMTTIARLSANNPQDFEKMDKYIKASNAYYTHENKLMQQNR